MGVPSLVFLVPQHCRCTCPRHSLPQGAARLCISCPTWGLVSEEPGWQDKQLPHWHPLLCCLQNILVPCPGPLGRLTSQAPEPLAPPSATALDRGASPWLWAEGGCSQVQLWACGKESVLQPAYGELRELFPMELWVPQPRGRLSMLTQGGWAVSSLPKSGCHPYSCTNWPQSQHQLCENGPLVPHPHHLIHRRMASERQDGIFPNNTVS